MEQESAKEYVERNSIGLKNTVHIIMSIYMISLLFFLFLYLAFKSDIRTCGMIKNPLPLILLLTNLSGTLYLVFHAYSKKQSINKHSIIITIISQIVNNLVLGYCTYMYLISLRLDDLLLLFMAGFLLKYIISHLAIMADNVHNSKSFLRNK